MSTNIRRHRRERARRRGAVMIKCHVCGREGPRRSMVHRDERWVCRRIPQCMDRVLAPPPPPVPMYARRDLKWSLSDLSGLRNSFGQLVPAFQQLGEAAAAGFKPLGYLSDDGIQRKG